MFELIALTIAAITAAVTVGISENKKNKERKNQEALTSEAYAKEGEEIRQAQWDAVNQGFLSGNLLIKAAYIEAVSQKQYRAKKAKEQEEFKNMLLYVGLAAAALIVIILIIKNRK